MDNHDIWFIRHAESYLNNATVEFSTRNNLPIDWNRLCENPAFLREVRYNQDFVDCSITERGKNQCLQAREQIINHLNPDVILVSPLERTLQTCHHLFSNRNIPVFVQPVLSEDFKSSCDFGSQIEGKIQRYPHYNFDSLLQQGELWYVKNDSQSNQQKYNKLLQDHTEKPLQEKHKIILDYMLQTAIHETYENLRHRGYRIKELLKKYKKKYNTIAVVAHFNIIRFTIAREFGQTHQAVNYGTVHNCELKKESLSELLKYR